VGDLERFYGEGNRYQQIADASGIPNPDLIYPGQVLTIPLAVVTRRPAQLARSPLPNGKMERSIELHRSETALRELGLRYTE